LELIPYCPLEQFALKLLSKKLPRMTAFLLAVDQN